MSCKKCMLNFKQRRFEKPTEKLAIFKSLPQPFGSKYFNETWHIYLVVFSCCKNIFGDAEIQG